VNILIYFPYNQRTVEQQSVMQMLKEKGHNVVLLTTCERGYLHGWAESIGVAAEAASGAGEGKVAFYLKNLKKLRQVVDRYKIDLVIAHQQITALIAGLLKKLKRFKLIYVRHNSDEDYQLNSRKATWNNRIVNALTPVKVAPSSVVENFWRTQEKVDAKNLYRVNYGYDFSQYEQPDSQEVASIRKHYATKMMILSVARLVPSKRHHLMFEVVKQLRDRGVDCKLVCLGPGPLEAKLNQLVADQGLSNHIHLLGRRENVMDYMAACDVFLHLSSTEASNSATKEAGLLKKPVIVCDSVGDFTDYIDHGTNGFLVSKEQPVAETVEILDRMANGQLNGKAIGEQLSRTVLEKFSIGNVAAYYDALLEKVMNQQL